jgi:hypothetical protein
MAAESTHRPPWHCCLQLSLRAMIIVVLLIGAWLGWIARNARIQREAVRAIKWAGGDVLYDFRWKGGHLIPAGKPFGPKWLVGLLGVDHFCAVTWVSFVRSPCSDDELKQIGRLKHLETLILFGSQMTDDGLENLEGLAELRLLELHSARVTDAGIARLRCLANLEHLDIAGCDVSDRGLESLSGMTSLRSIGIRRTRITGSGFERLRRDLPRARSADIHP